MVINYDDLAENIQSVYERVSDFAGIPLHYVQDQDPSEVGIHFDKKVRADKQKDDRPMGDEIRNYLTEFYAPYVEELEALLGPKWSAEKLGWNNVASAKG